MWTRDKIADFCEDYMGFKNYGVWFQSSDGQSAIKPPRTHRAPFEDKAIDVAEFDMAVNQLGRTEKFCFLTSLLGLERRDIAWFSHLDGVLVEIILDRAKRKVESYLIQLYKRNRSK